MAGYKIYQIANIWKFWNEHKMSSDEAMLAIGKLLPDYTLHPVKKTYPKPKGPTYVQSVNSKETKQG